MRTKYVNVKDGRCYINVRLRPKAGEKTKWKLLSTDFKSGQEKLARAVRDDVQNRLDAGEEFTGHTGPITVESFSKRWLVDRKESVKSWKNDEYTLRLHVNPTIGPMRIEEVRPVDVKNLVVAWRKTFAPKTVWTMYSVLGSLFRDAAIEGLLQREHTPCILTVRQLGEKKLKDRDYRRVEIFKREEVEALISDLRLTEDQRVEHALKGIGGLRHNDMKTLTWERCYAITDAEPLDGMYVYGKDDVDRAVPIHPTLAAILAQWKMSGWERMMGRKPMPEDLVLPVAENPAQCNQYEQRVGGARSRQVSLGRLQRDLETLGLRKRNQHALRATMLSLTESDGGMRSIFRRATHKPPREVLDGYITFEWPILCREISKLNIRRRGEAKVIQLPGATQNAPHYDSITKEG